MATATTTTKKTRSRAIPNEGTTNSSARETDGSQKTTGRRPVVKKRTEDEAEREGDRNPSPASENFRNVDRGGFTAPPVRSPEAGSQGQGSPARSADEVRSNSSQKTQGGAPRPFLLPRMIRPPESPSRQVALNFGAAPYVSTPMGTPGFGVRVGVQPIGQQDRGEHSPQQGTLAQELEQARRDQRESALRIQRLEEEARQYQLAREQADREARNKGKKRATARSDSARDSPAESTEQLRTVTHQWVEAMQSVPEKTRSDLLKLFQQQLEEVTSRKERTDGSTHNERTRVAPFAGIPVNRNRYAQAGTSAQGQQMEDQVQDTSKDARIASWFRENPTKDMRDYQTRPLTPPAVTGGEPRIEGLYIGENDEERARMQRQRNDDLNTKGLTAIVSQGVRWSSPDGYPYDVWPPERLAKVKTYWKHQSAIMALSGEPLHESDTTLRYAYGEFDEDQDYAPRRMEVSPSLRRSAEWAGGPPGGGPPNPPGGGPSHPPSERAQSAPQSNHGRRREQPHHQNDGGGGGGGPPPHGNGGDGDDGGSDASNDSGSTAVQPYYGDESEESGSGEPTGPQRNHRRRSVVNPYTVDPRRRQRHYNHSVKKKYAQWIEEQLGESIVPDDPSIKLQVVKVKDPDSWSGGRDLEKFKDWLYAMFRWLRISRLGGPGLESLRVSHFCYHLHGEAGRWVQDNVEGVHRRKRTWTLLEVVMGLYHYFIHETAIQDATERFETARYRTNTEDYYQTLARLASRMIHPPDWYTFRTRLMEGLPSDILDKILSKGITAETSNTATIVAEARIAEDTKLIKLRYERKARERARTSTAVRSTTQSRAPLFTGSRPVGNGGVHQPRTRFRLVRRSTSAPLREGNRADSQPAGMNRSSATPSQGGNRASVSRTPAPRTSVPPRRGITPQSTRQASTHPPVRPGIKCHICNGPHYANECEERKPRPASTQVYATRTIVDDTEEALATQVHGDSEASQEQERVHHERDLVQLRAMSPVDAVDDDDEYIEFFEEEELEETPEEATQWEEGGEEPAIQLHQMRTSGFDTPLAVAQRTSRSPSPIYMGAIIATEEPATIATAIVDDNETQDRPKDDPQRTKLITQLVKINGVDAFTLFDTGSTANAVSNDFCTVHLWPKFCLRKPLQVELGLSGSRGSIRFGTRADIAVPGVQVRKHYLDIANLSRYDAIIGKPLMAEMGIMVDPQNDCLVIKRTGERWKSLTEGEERAVMARKHTLRPRTSE